MSVVGYDRELPSKPAGPTAHGACEKSWRRFVHRLAARPTPLPRRMHAAT